MDIGSTSLRYCNLRSGRVTRVCHTTRTETERPHTWTALDGQKQRLLEFASRFLLPTAAALLRSLLLLLCVLQLQRRAADNWTGPFASTLDDMAAISVRCGRSVGMTVGVRTGPACGVRPDLRLCGTK